MTSLEVVSAGLCGLGTLLGPEATGLLLPPGGGGCVVAPSWWWGVVFVLWIVVASI